MLLVKTYLKQTKNKGVGLFAAEDIPAGTITWRYHALFDRVITDETYHTLNNIERDFLDYYATHEDDDMWHLSVDNDRFLNHSENPNIAYVGGNIEIALRDIKKDEEMTIDYREIDIECRKNLGFINNEDGI